jgi:uncharacterized caspase-like protein
MPDGDEPERPPSRSSRRDHRVALCIGNDAYGGSSMLPNCVHDAEDMGTCASDSMGFDHVHVLRDATKGQIDAQIRRLCDSVIRTGSIVLFYFSGHGAEHEGITYLLPLGMASYEKDDLEGEAVSLNYVLKALNAAAQDTVNLLFLDCCRANDLDPTFKGTKAAGGTDMTAKGGPGSAETFDRAKTDSQYLIGLACDPGTVAWANGGARNSR